MSTNLKKSTLSDHNDKKFEINTQDCGNFRSKYNLNNMVSEEIEQEYSKRSSR
jgi:hypothetical protein